MKAGSKDEAKRIIEQWRSLAERNIREGKEELEQGEKETDHDLKRLSKEIGQLGIQAGQRILDWCNEEDIKLSVS